MNYLNVQKELLKAADGRDGWKSKRFPYRYGLTEDSVCIMNSDTVWVIPKNLFYLDINRVFGDQMPIRMDSFIKAPDYKAIFTGDKKILSNGITACLFKLENGQMVGVNEKLLKDFNSFESNFRGTSSKTLVHIYECERLVGIVMPVNMG